MHKIKIYGAKVNTKLTSNDRFISDTGIFWTEINQDWCVYERENALSATITHKQYGPGSSGTNNIVIYNYYKVVQLTEYTDEVIDETTQYWFDLSSIEAVTEGTDRRQLTLDVVHTHWSAINNHMNNKKLRVERFISNEPVLSSDYRSPDVDLSQANLYETLELPFIVGELDPDPLTIHGSLYRPMTGAGLLNTSARQVLKGKQPWNGYVLQTFKSLTDPDSDGNQEPIREVEVFHPDNSLPGETIYGSRDIFNIYPSPQAAYFTNTGSENYIFGNKYFTGADDVNHVWYPWPLDGYLEIGSLDMSDSNRNNWTPGRYNIDTDPLKLQTANHDISSYKNQLDNFKNEYTNNLFNDPIMSLYDKLEMYHLDLMKEVDIQLFSEISEMKVEYKPGRENYQIKFSLETGNYDQKITYTDSIEDSMLGDTYLDYLTRNKQSLDAQRDAIKLQESQSTRNAWISTGIAAAGIIAAPFTAGATLAATAAVTATAGASAINSFMSASETASQSIASLEATVADMANAPNTEGAMASGIGRIDMYDKFKYKYHRVPVKLKESIAIHHYLYGHNVGRYVDWSDLFGRNIFNYIQSSEMDKALSGAEMGIGNSGVVTDEMAKAIGDQFSVGVRIFNTNADITKKYDYNNPVKTT